MHDKRKGGAARMWQAYRGLVDPMIKPVTDGVAHSIASRLVGFFVTWHLYGGYDGLVGAGWNRTAVWRNRQEFRKVFGVEVEDAWPEFAEFVRGMK